MSATLTPETTVPCQGNAVGADESYLLRIEEQVHIAASTALGLHCAIVIETAKAELRKPTEQCHLMARLWDVQGYIVRLCAETATDTQ